MPLVRCARGVAVDVSQPDTHNGCSGCPFVRATGPFDGTLTVFSQDLMGVHWFMRGQSRPRAAGGVNALALGRSIRGAGSPMSKSNTQGGHKRAPPCPQSNQTPTVLGEDRIGASWFDVPRRSDRGI